MRFTLKIGMLMLFILLIQLGILDSRVLTPSTDCLGPDGGLCNTDVWFDYYFWNISNAPEVLNLLDFSNPCCRPWPRLYPFMTECVM